MSSKWRPIRYLHNKIRLIIVNLIINLHKIWINHIDLHIEHWEIKNLVIIFKEKIKYNKVIIYDY